MYAVFKPEIIDNVLKYTKNKKTFDTDEILSNYSVSDLENEENYKFDFVLNKKHSHRFEKYLKWVFSDFYERFITFK